MHIDTEATFVRELWWLVTDKDDYEARPECERNDAATLPALPEEEDDDMEGEEEDF